MIQHYEEPYNWNLNITRRYDPVAMYIAAYGNKEA
jgi:hypothetical protein